jgi:hypothetical protein
MSVPFVHVEGAVASEGRPPVALVAALSGLGVAVFITVCGLLVIYRRRPKRLPEQLQISESNA